VGATGAIGPQGPAGATGATGPIGPQGPAGANDAIYATSTTATIAPNAIIPITQTASTPQTSMSIIDNAVAITENGTYLVSFSGSGNDQATSILVDLYLNDTPVTGEFVSVDGVGLSSKTAILNLDAGDELALFNGLAEQSTISQSSIAVVKLG
jgi:hypothetical protein